MSIKVIKGGNIKDIIWAICLDAELAANPGYWVVARDYDSESEATAETSLEKREMYRLRKGAYGGEKIESGTYALDGSMLDGGVYKLVRKEDAQ